MKIRQTYAKLPVAVKLLLPLLFLFFGISAVGMFSFFTDYIEKSLMQETERLSSLVLQNFQQTEEILQIKGRWLAERSNLSKAVVTQNQALLLQTLLPMQATLKLDLICIVDSKGSVLLDLRREAIREAKLQDRKVKQLAKDGLELSKVVFTDGKTPSVVIAIVPLKSQEKLLGGLVVGYAVSKELLTQMRTSSNQHLVILQDSQVIASTLVGVAKLSWQPPPPESPVIEMRVGDQNYFVKTMPLTTNQNSKLKFVLLNSTAPLEEAGQKLKLMVGSFCLFGGTISAIVGFWLTRLLTSRIHNLTIATEKLAAGDLTTRIPVNSNDEIGILAQGFNFMAEQLTLRDEKINHQMQVLENTLIKLQQTQAQLIQSKKMSSLGQMIAGIAHEINNPTSFIQGNLTYISEYTQKLLHLLQLYQQYYPQPVLEIQRTSADIELDFLQEDFPKLVKSMEIGSDRITEIVLSLRNFSRLDESECKRVNIHEGIDSTLMILTNRLKVQPKRPEITVIKEYSEIPLIECYPGQLNQVFMNILTNAIDALEESMANYQLSVVENPGQLTMDYGLLTKPQIHICTQFIDKKYIKISITDNGSGIKEEIRSKLFDPFFTTKPVGKGTGLGLSISYQIIVEKHRGNIECHSKLGKGTTFVIQIPVSQINMLKLA